MSGVSRQLTAGKVGVEVEAPSPLNGSPLYVHEYDKFAPSGTLVGSISCPSQAASNSPEGIWATRTSTNPSRPLLAHPALSTAVTAIEIGPAGCVAGRSNSKVKAPLPSSSWSLPPSAEVQDTVVAAPLDATRFTSSTATLPAHAASRSSPLAQEMAGMALTGMVTSKGASELSHVVPSANVEFWPTVMSTLSLRACHVREVASPPLGGTEVNQLYSAVSFKAVSLTTVTSNMSPAHKVDAEGAPLKLSSRGVGVCTTWVAVAEAEHVAVLVPFSLVTMYTKPTVCSTTSPSSGLIRLVKPRLEFPLLQDHSAVGVPATSLA